MDLYFMPLACSMATRVALYEAGTAATYVEIDPLTKRTLDGKQDLRLLNPLGLVPTLRTDAGDVLTENASILQYIAELQPDTRLAPRDELGKARLRQWLCFIGTELHKATFAPFFDRKSPEVVKAYALEKGRTAFAYVNEHLTSRETLLDQFSIADAYLVTVLHWTLATPIKLDDYPALKAYFARHCDRPSVARALAEERPLYIQELARHKAAAQKSAPAQGA